MATRGREDMEREGESESRNLVGKEGIYNLENIGRRNRTDILIGSGDHNIN